MIDDYTIIFPLSCTVLSKRRSLLILKRTFYVLLVNKAVVYETFASHISCGEKLRELFE